MLRFANQFWNLGRGDLPRRSPVAALLHDLFLAAVLVGLAFLVRWMLGLIGPVLIFAVCYPMLLCATLLAGLRAGLLALLFSVLLFWYVFVPEYYSFNIPTVVDGANVALYALAGIAVIWISQRYRVAHANLQAETARSELLIREMQHRSKNALAVVTSIVNQSLKDHPDTARTITGRLAALTDSENMIWGDSVQEIPLKELLKRELASYDPERLHLDGPDVTVSGELARTLSLVVHELATNAVKHGAWSNTSGVVTLTWGDGPSPSFLKWTESGGPTPKQDGKSGFGTVLISRLLTQHRGRLETIYTASGIVRIASFVGEAVTAGRQAGGRAQRA